MRAASAVQPHFRRSFAECQSAKAGKSWEDVVKTTVFARTTLPAKNGVMG
jgi:hypothetical protein